MQSKLLPSSYQKCYAEAWLQIRQGEKRNVENKIPNVWGWFCVVWVFSSFFFFKKKQQATGIGVTKKRLIYAVLRMEEQTTFLEMKSRARTTRTTRASLTGVRDEAEV